MASYLESIDSQLAQGVNPTDANSAAIAQTTAVANPDGNPVATQAPVDIAPVNEPVINTPTVTAPSTSAPTVDTGVTQTTSAAGNVVAADTNAAATAIGESASQQNLYKDLSTIDKTQVETRIDNAVANQKEYQAINEAQIAQKQANEEEYQQMLRENQEEEIAALRIQQDSENIANQAAAAEMKAKTDAAERELAIQNDIALQKSSIAFAKLGLSFSGAAINQAQQIFTTGMYNLSSLKSTNAKNYADLQVKINSVQFDHIQQIGKLVQDTAEKEFASKERLRDFIGTTQNNILKNKEEAQKDIMDAIDKYKTERQGREDKLYADMNNANSNLQKATKDIQNTISTQETNAKTKIDMLISNGQWNSLSIAQKNQMEQAAGVPVGTTAQTIVAKTTVAINDRLKAIVGSAVAVPPLILAKIHTEIKRSLALNVPLITATQQAVDKYSNQIPAVKAKAEAANAKAELDASKVTLNEASASAKLKTADAAMIKAVKAGTKSSGASSKDHKAKAYAGTDADGSPLVDIGGVPHVINADGTTGGAYIGQVKNKATPSATSDFLKSITPTTQNGQPLFKNTAP